MLPDLHIYENSRGNKKILYTGKSVLFVQLLKHFPFDSQTKIVKFTFVLF